MARVMKGALGDGGPHAAQPRPYPIFERVIPYIDCLAWIINVKDCQCLAE